MVEKEVMDLIQIFSWVATASGVCFAAYYYITTLRNAEREKRKQTILQKLPAMSKDYYESYYTIQLLQDWETREEYIEKHASNPEIVSKVFYLMNIYNILGILYKEGLMSIEDICQLYPPYGIIGMFERFWFLLPVNRKNFNGEDSDPDFYVPFEKLYKELKKRYPKLESYPNSKKEQQERSRMKRETVFSKLSKEAFLESVMK